MNFNYLNPINLKNLLNQIDISLDIILQESNILQVYCSKYKPLEIYFKKHLKNLLDLCFENNNFDISLRAFLILISDNDFLLKYLIISKDLLRIYNKYIRNNREYLQLSRFISLTEKICLLYIDKCFENCPYLNNLIQICDYFSIFQFFRDIFNNIEHSLQIITQFIQKGFFEKLLEQIFSIKNNFKEKKLKELNYNTYELII